MDSTSLKRNLSALARVDYKQIKEALGGRPDDYILVHSAKELFDVWLNFEGIIGYSDRLWGLIEDLQEYEPRKVWQVTASDADNSDIKQVGGIFTSVELAIKYCCSITEEWCNAYCEDTDISENEKDEVRVAYDHMQHKSMWLDSPHNPKAHYFQFMADTYTITELEMNPTWNPDQS